MSSNHPRPEPFGTQLGVAPGGVPAYSSHYPSASDHDFPDRESYRSYLDGHFMGYKWQCVEFARRWLYQNHGWLFDDVAMAYDIFELRSGRRVKDNAPLPLYAFRNGSPRWPKPGALLIWEEGGEFEDTGHVAIVTEVFRDRIRIAEQNVDHQCWAAGADYARELPVEVDAGNGYRIRCTYETGTILGWVMQTQNATFAEPLPRHAPELLRLQSAELPSAPTGWLNADSALDNAYRKAMDGELLTQQPERARRYYCLSESAAHELKHASNELHAMFMHATHRVLRDDNLLVRFNLPPSIWPRLRASWNNRRNQMITGRFDFALRDGQLKVYEYNADSASCHTETGRLQGRWFRAAGMESGRDPGQKLFGDLVNAWRKSGVDSVLHILQDDDPEETYHARFMQQAAEKAGLTTRIIRGMGELNWNAEGQVVDASGEPVRWVWKTWAWETALDQLRAECDEEEALATIGSSRPRADKPRLVDVLLRPEVMVYEPLWTLIPSNKAILPILWELFPDNPWLLEAHYELTPDLAAKGYVAKPIAGRCGFNISLVDKHNGIVEETSGQFGAQDQVYQGLFALPQLDDLYVQLGTFSVDGKYSAASVRVDPSPVITTHSDLLPLRILADDDFLSSQTEETR